MHVIKGDTLEQVYLHLLRDVKNLGKKVSPRGMETLEIHPCTIVLSDPCENLIISKARALNPLFMIGEFLWIFAGRNDVEFISMFNKKMRDYSDDGVTLHGAYGSRLYDFRGVNQLQYCIDKLRNDPDTRQACISIFDPARDCSIVTKDFPCNHYLKFTRRDDRLDLTVYVRSQDIILGFPYDVFHWTILQQLMSQMLGIKCGTYYHIMDSAHLYSYHYEMCDRIIADEENSFSDGLEIDINCETFGDFQKLCNNMITCIEQKDMIALLAVAEHYSHFAAEIAQLFGFNKYTVEELEEFQGPHTPLLLMLKHYKQKIKK